MKIDDEEEDGMKMRKKMKESDEVAKTNGSLFFLTVGIYLTDGKLRDQNMSFISYGTKMKT